MPATKVKPAANPAAKSLIDLFDLPDKLLKVLNGRGFHTLGDVERAMHAAGNIVCKNWLWERFFLALTWEDCETFHEIYCDEMHIQDEWRAA